MFSLLQDNDHGCFNEVCFDLGRNEIVNKTLSIYNQHFSLCRSGKALRDAIIPGTTFVISLTISGVA